MIVPKIFIRRPHLPGPRRLPRNIKMSLNPQPKFHAKCGTRKMYHFADGQHWCETCGEHVNPHANPPAPRAPQGVVWTTKVLK